MNAREQLDRLAEAYGRTECSPRLVDEIERAAEGCAATDEDLAAVVEGFVRASAENKYPPRAGEIIRALEAQARRRLAAGRAACGCAYGYVRGVVYAGPTLGVATCMGRCARCGTGRWYPDAPWWRRLGIDLGARYVEEGGGRVAATAWLRALDDALVRYATRTLPPAGTEIEWPTEEARVGLRAWLLERGWMPFALVERRDPGPDRKMLAAGEGR